MSIKQNIFVLAFSAVLFSAGGVVHGQICDVLDDGSGCLPQAACGVIPEDQCLPAALRIDWTTGAIAVAECHCQDMNACHIEFGNATPFAVGYCPPDAVCEVEGTDLDNDGLPDLFRAVCRPDGVSVCCLDIDDGPVPFDTCADLGEEGCAAEGGVHHIARVGCSGKQACCLGSLTQPLCAELHPACCLMSGGVPLGPESTCTTPDGVEACGQFCGGIAGFPCDDPRAFCRLPDGGCCCDFMGMCTLPPETCPTVLDPVCGCDNHTYRNECEAFAAEVSIDHRGPCCQTACCLPDGGCAVLTLDVCVAEGGEPVLNAGCETVTCAPAPTGACCVSDAAGLAFCQIRTHDECRAIGGTYIGDGTECPTDPNTICGVFACCLPNGSCATLPIESCLVEGGEPQQVANCDTVFCTPHATGACCLPNAAGLPSCVHRTQARCAELGGAYQGDNSTCPANADVPCGEHPCCLPTDVCVMANSEVCLAEGGRPVAAGGCDVVDCLQDPVGACCINDPATNVNCIVRTRAECASVGGVYQGDGSTCSSDASLACGEFACCLPNGACAVLAIDHCVAEGGSPIPGVHACDTVECVPPPVGACCLNSAAGSASCVVVSHAECAAQNGAYQGDNTSCPTDPNITCGDRCDGLCTDAASCFVGCGKLVQGFECVWFQLESGDVFVLDDLGGFAVGDHVFVKGCRSTDCTPTLCIPADPCLTVITIRSCPPTCGGIAGIPCEDPSQFCKFPDGTCGEGDISGVCVSGGGGGICPAVWLPVCGCDGRTYGNECNATSAGVSVAYHGECVSTCGGIAGIPCEDPGQFCRFPEGTCGDGDISGHCVTPPDGCPDVWDPVCGCDGATYSNECDAAAAAVSIEHRGECLRICGGLGPAPPCEPNEFCRFPVGFCGDQLSLGVCTAVPSACPEIFDPVCGCDGTTYSNACEASRAMVSIAHPGECMECTAIRVFSDPPFSYCPPDEKQVRIVLNAPANASAIAVDDQPPAGWTVGEIGQGGVFDSVNGKVKWGPIFQPFPPALTYFVTPADTNTAGSCFDGVVSIDGFNRPICGPACLERSCCPPLDADKPQPACDQCPGSGCETCDDACGNGRVTMCELISYACAWRHGCNDDLAGMTRAAFIWRNGECHCWDDASHTWLPTDCDPAGASCCSAGTSATSGLIAVEDPSTGVTVQIRRTTGNRFSRATETILEAVITPPQGTMASGLEIDIPQDWKTVKVSNGGEWDAAHGKVKWGPIFGDGQTVVSITIRREMKPVSQKSRDGGRIGKAGIAATPSLKEFGGTVAFDGIMRPVSFK